MPCRAHLLAHGAGVADDAARPFQHPLALRRQALEARAAVDEHDAELSSSCLIAADSVGWVTPHCLGGAAEMPLLGERDEEFQLVDHPLPAPAWLPVSRSVDRR